MPEISNNLGLLSLKDAAEFSPYSADYLNLLVRKGKIPGRKIGRDWLIMKRDLLQYLHKQQVDSENRVRQISKYLHGHQF